MTDNAPDYNPKHMIDKEVVLDRWQTQTASAAALLHPDVHQNTGNDTTVRTLLSAMSESRELLGMFYDFGDDGTYEPKHMV